MGITRAQVEQELTQRLGNWLAQAGKDGSTDDGTNKDLNGPIAFALRKLGGTVANLSNVSASDFNAVTDAQLDQLFDLAELRTLKNILGNLDQVNYKMGPISKDMSDLRNSVETRITALTEEIETSYGYASAWMPDATIEPVSFTGPVGDIWSVGQW